MRLRNKVAIVTGVGRGIGRTLAKRLAVEGARVVIAQRSEETARSVLDDIREKGGEACFLQTDISIESSAISMAEKTVEIYGSIDVLINNATVSLASLGPKPFDQIPVEEWDRVMAVNLKGTWLCCKAVAPFMKRQKKGKIINTSSSAWDTGDLPFLHYLASKAGIVGLTRGLARELGDWNINVNCVSYGPVITESNREIYTRERQIEDLKKQCIKRPAVPEEIVGTVMFLASEESDFITGQTIHPNGGIYFH
ncbi:MAG: 3-oxoacyl-ACP reductase FabG [Deltaproteobacteria bacterium]|nr:3-oxoacyl-ACP reductase FabG [Deltaproteobacteria bacterium]